MKKSKRNKIKKSPSEIIFDVVVYTVLAIVTVVTFYPLWYVVVASFSPGSYIAEQGAALLWPGEFTLGAYKLAFNHPLLLGSFKNSILILLISLPINIILTVLCAYFMSSTNMLWKKPIVMLITFTMFFNAGIIPRYLTVKDLGLYDTIWSLILPVGLSVYNAIICKTAMEGIPPSLHESAYVDGANDMTVLFKIVLPLIKPTLAVLILYYGVQHWNAWFDASIFIKTESKLPVQNILRAVLMANRNLAEGAGDSFNAYAESIQYAAIVIITVPILCVYPFLQKHFAKGVMIGAVKG